MRIPEMFLQALFLCKVANSYTGGKKGLLKQDLKEGMYPKCQPVLNENSRNVLYKLFCARLIANSYTVGNIGPKRGYVP